MSGGNDFSMKGRLRYRMLNLNLSNRFEDLLAALLKNLHSSPASVFEPERIIMPSAAVKRCLTMAIADTFGVCANVEFSFLAQWLWRQVGHLVPVQKTSPFSSTVLVWRILRLLQEPGFADPYPRLVAYLSSSDEVMRYDLAARLAALMEQYVIYRPDWLSAWAKGERANIVPADHKKFDTAESDQCWQAALWRRIAEETGTREKQPVELFFEALSHDGEKAASLLDARIHLFCEPSIAPQYIDMLEKLGHLIDIELYVLNPCREYWFDIVDSRRLAYLASRQKDLYHETGNTLLASWGKQTKASLESMLECLSAIEEENGTFISNAEMGVPETLLSHLQDAILELRELEPASLSHLGDDGSIRIHVAHSLTREIEILHDQLLLRFASDDPPAVDRILVVTPDLDAAAPMIEAVFSHNSHHQRIPYVITGLSGNRINPVARALLDLLALASSRFSASDVIDLLMQPLIGNTFGFDGDLKTLRNWFADAGICWGLDGAHKSEFDLPEDDSHSFHDGMHRLFLAYALPDDEQRPLANRLPAGNPSGSQAVALGQLWQFTGGLRHLKRELSRLKTADGWMQTFFDVLESFMTVPPEMIDSEREVRSCISDWHAAMTEGSPELETGFAIARHALERALEGSGQGSVPAGTVTFAPMDSLRNLPFDHIYVIGLDDGVFPADRNREEFDLIGVSPRKSDKLPRESDRNVFLDLLCSARKSLYLSYSGKNIRDNSAKPPSILVSELIKSLKPALAASNDPADLAAAERMLVVEHPLQAFSIDYFNGKGDHRLVSFRADLCEAQRIRQERQQARQEESTTFTVTTAMATEDSDDDTTTDKTLPFFTSPLPKPEPGWQEVGLEQLIRFFSHPARYLLGQRLGIRFSSKEEELPSAEPFTIDRQHRRQLAQRLLPLFLEGRDEESIRLAALAGNEFPSGQMGRNWMDQELMELAAFARTAMADLQPDTVSPLTDSLEFMIDGQEWRLSGALTELRKNGLVRLRYDNGSAWDYLAGWIEHLFLNAVATDGIEPQSVWHYKNESLRLDAYGEAKNRLGELMEIYRTGLMAPIHFFPRSSWEFVASNDSMNKAKSVWIHAQNANAGEHAEPYTQLAMRGVVNPLDKDFIELSKRVFAPLYGHLKGSAS